MNKMEKQLGVIPDITLLLLHAQIGDILKGVGGGVYAGSYLQLWRQPICVEKEGG